MKTANLVKETITHIYKDENGEILNLTSEQKLMHSLFKPDLCTTIINTEIIDTWIRKTKKEIESMYLTYIKDNDIQSDEYYIKYL